MEKKFNFLMAIHFHQPVDNFGFVFEEITEKCYEPFLNTIQDFPSVKFNLHYSGSLLEWFRDNRPNILDMIRKVVDAGQAEIIGGGFYEPIISSVLPHEAAGQIEMMSGFLRANFKANVKGAWIAERIWEGHIPELLSDCGVEYTIIDDQHLIYAGCKEHQVFGHYLTEHNSKTLTVIPSDKFLRYAIPFKAPGVSFDFFKSIIKNFGRHTVCYGDDGEKFGAWPGTHRIVYKKDWLRKFLYMMDKNSPWLKTWRISDYLSENRPNGLIYLPNVSYEEMNEWSLPTKACEGVSALKEHLKKSNMLSKYNMFLRTGIWNNFLIKYPESNHMQKRVSLVSRRLLEISKKVNQAEGQEKNIQSQELLSRARRELYKAECNCAYWHGVFGGLYLYHLRASLYKHIIEAENILDQLEKKECPRIEIQETDFDCDGEKELIINTGKNTVIVDKAEGACVAEWSLKARPLNIVNTLARRRECYHKNIKKKLYYDDYKRCLFIDHFLKDPLTLKQLMQNQYKECGDFSDAVYPEALIRDGNIVEFQRHGFVEGRDIILKKCFVFGIEKETIKAVYEIMNPSPKPVNFYFAPELNFSITEDNKQGVFPDTDSLSFHDKIENIKVDINFSRPADKLLRFPVQTVSQTQKEPETNYQATCVVPVFKISLDANSLSEISINISVHSSF
jgi:4-alpha-glucanotransferase